MAVCRHCGGYFEVNTGWRRQAIDQPTRLRAFRLLTLAWSRASRSSSRSGAARQPDRGAARCALMPYVPAFHPCLRNQRLGLNGAGRRSGSIRRWSSSARGADPSARSGVPVGAQAGLVSWLASARGKIADRGGSGPRAFIDHDHHAVGADRPRLDKAERHRVPRVGEQPLSGAEDDRGHSSGDTRRRGRCRPGPARGGRCR
jgi:hypothetical protein